MKTKFIEATNGFNWGKFMIARFEPAEWERPSAFTGHTAAVGRGSGLLGQIGWANGHTLILDLQTGEGAIFSPGGYAPADLEKHAVWVCPLFPPFLAWLWDQKGLDIMDLPDKVEIPAAPPALSGYRHAGHDRDIAFLETINAAAERDILAGNPVEGAHHRAIEAALEELRNPVFGKALLRDYGIEVTK